MISIRHLFIALLVSGLHQFCHNTPFNFCDAWVIPSLPTPSTTRSSFTQRQPSPLFSTTTSNDEKGKSSTSESAIDDDSQTKSEAAASSDSDSKSADLEEKKDEQEEEDDDDEEYEYIEYETLTEADYLGSEWLVGTLWDSNTNQIKETWVRLATKGDKNIAIWGDNSEGTWSLDVASQFLAISKEFLWGKQIWAGVVDDYYFVQGTVRGWTYLTPASVLGQWQGKRLGVDPDEAGTPPWFEVADVDDDSEQEEADSDN